MNISNFIIGQRPIRRTIHKAKGHTVFAIWNIFTVVYIKYINFLKKFDAQSLNSIINSLERYFLLYYHCHIPDYHWIFGYGAVSFGTAYRRSNNLHIQFKYICRLSYVQPLYNIRMNLANYSNLFIISLYNSSLAEV